MKEKIDEAIIKSFERGSVAQELLDPLSLSNGAEYSIQRRAFVLSPQATVESVFNAYDPKTQEEFREGLTEAMKRWENGKLKPKIYTRLIYLCGDTENISALPLLIGTTKRKDLNLDKEDDSAVMRATIGTISWLNTYVNENTRKENIDHLKTLCYEPYYERYVGMMMNGICTFRPDEFPDLFPRFLEVFRQHPEYYVLDACIREAIRVVTPGKMNELLDRLADDARNLVEEQLLKQT